MWDCWNEGGIRRGKVGEFVLLLSLGICVYVSVCVQVLFMRRCSQVSPFSCAFTSGCWWSRGLLAQRPPRPLDSGDVVLGCDCGGEH